MPYINEERRDAIKSFNDPRTAGELNYVLTGICRDYWYEHGPNYATINDIVGALEGAKLEFYRRVAAPYEDEKIKENGDVY
jgi:hypothetical protein